ncbi:MAG: FkbM family methyltransferase [Pseudomonadota bacterium]
MRTLVKRLTRGWTFTRSVEIAGARRWLVVSPDARLAYLKPGSGAFEHELIDIARVFVEPDTVIWDIGANVGLFSVAALAFGAKQAVAIEADIVMAALIRRTARLHGDRITVVPAAISDRCGTASFQISDAGRASNTLLGTERETDQARHPVETVPTLTMDALLESQPAPAFIKIDVEGAEHLALAGAEAVLAHKPAIYAEISADVRPQVIPLLERFGYKGYNLAGDLVDVWKARDVLFRAD